MLMIALAVAAGLAAVAALYVLFVRPVIRRWQALKPFWEAADAFELGFWRRLQALFEGVKIKLLARLVWVPTLLVQGYDWFVQACGQCDLTPVTSHLPGWAQSALPLLSALVIPVLIDIARSYSSKPAA